MLSIYLYAMRNTIKFGLGIVFFFASSNLRAVDISLHINRGADVFFGSEIAWCSFNSSDTFSRVSERIEADFGEVINLTITNNDIYVHNVLFDSFQSVSIAQGESVEMQLTDLPVGIWRYYSDAPFGAFNGASGMLIISEPSTHARFYWNLFDLNIDLANAFGASDATTYPSDYFPELFYINGNRYPQTLDDPMAMIMGMVGDTLSIYIVNSGFMDHVMHFHGFHVEIMHASIQPERIGWIKDTIPVKRGEAMCLQLVANQPGMYPIHDHNLIAVTNAGLYPGGMITHINISE